ncbi:prevent-host-death protein [Haematobacter missouriensis]|uniref:Antitoxin n=1 Tax=Haematobacter missouriensis TaxID=366616 RepID=A0A212AMT4_9RHOB|nr:type II toxin-antitoxin system Phd/YefM family antitoxin [Haematobacter missouriensis]KFI32356.1 prevent-host-death protein [Haematobacter missouriensis]OWJ71117.1 type II toxin-antitoxin system prevent-host-death family antitoxin [Haematobacter missouriensis]OWJ82818.1 type II toxin-antitoxin system prevent-host-death family antitoxin [Haematobacter missouriensis]
MWTLQDAKNRFSAVVDAALSGRPQEVSRRGKPAVVVLSASEYQRLVRDAQAGRRSFVSHLLDFPGLEDASRPKVTPRDVDF